jgi:DNA-binding GntR family transcriptional regulator
MPAEEQSLPKSLKQVAYETLKQMIVSCEILPGALLTEDGLCEMLKASRTPVRDAISRLEQEHLVSIKPKKGIRVNRVSMNNIQELFEVRVMFAPYIVRNYGNRIRDEVYTRFIQQFKRTDCTREELFNLDNEFHQTFVDASNNRYLASVYEMIKDQVIRYRILSTAGNRLDTTQQEHHDIAMRCLCGNWDAAAEAMRVHIENSKLAIINYLMDTNRNAHNVFLEEEEE